MIDSHCHLDRLKIPDGETLDDSLARAAEEGVHGFLNVCIDLENFNEVLRIANADSRIQCSVGVHPNEMELQEPTMVDLLLGAENQ